MAGKRKLKASPGSVKVNAAKPKTYVKYVHKAGMWVKTTVTGDTQKQEWSTTKP